MSYLPILTLLDFKILTIECCCVNIVLKISFFKQEIALCNVMRFKFSVKHAYLLCHTARCVNIMDTIYIDIHKQLTKRTFSLRDPEIPSDQIYALFRVVQYQVAIFHLPYKVSIDQLMFCSDPNGIRVIKELWIFILYYFLIFYIGIFYL